MAELTGKIRYRVQQRLLRKPLIVAQVEVYGFDPGGRHDEGEMCRWWIDASLETIYSAQEIQRKSNRGFEDE